MATSIIRGRYLVTRAGDDSSQVISDGALYQRDGVIEEVGQYSVIREKHQADVEIGGDQFLVIPGLVNSHHHGKGITGFQLGSLDDQLEYWIINSWGHKGRDPYLDTAYSCMNLVRSGTTTVMFNHTPSVAETLDEDCRRILEGIRSVGVRAAYSTYLENQYRIVAEEDQSFLSRLPSELAGRLKKHLSTTHISDDEYLDSFSGMHEEWDDGAKMRIFLAPANAHWVSDEMLQRMKEYASRFNTGIHIHLVENVYEKLIGIKRFGETPMQHLEKLGFLGTEVSLAHGVWLTDGDIELAAGHGVSVCHNPSSNLRLKSGIAPVPVMLAKGVNVGIGTDGYSINDDEDLLQEMRLAHMLHNPPGAASPSLTSHQMLKMTTVNGAKTTLFPDIGALEKGMKADVVLVRLDRLTEPYLDPNASIVDALVYRGRAQDVDTVIIDGEVVLRDGRFVNIDEEDVKARLKASLERPPTENEIATAQTVGEMMPYVKRFYESWGIGEQVPYFKYNSSR